MLERLVEFGRRIRKASKGILLGFGVLVAMGVDGCDGNYTPSVCNIPDISNTGDIAICLDKKGEYNLYTRSDNDLYLFDDEGNFLRQLTNTNEIDVSPVWRPDGKQIIFTKGESNGDRFYICIINPNGANERRVTSSGKDVCPVYSPDGKEVVFVSGRDFEEEHLDKESELYIMNKFGGRQRRLTFNNGVEYPFGWSSDFRELYFWKEVEEKQEDSTITTTKFYKMNLETGDVAKVDEELGELVKKGKISFIPYGDYWASLLNLDDKTNGPFDRSYDGRFIVGSYGPDSFEVVENREGEAVYNLSGKLEQYCRMKNDIQEAQSKLEELAEKPVEATAEVEEATTEIKSATPSN